MGDVVSRARTQKKIRGRRRRIKLAEEYVLKDGSTFRIVGFRNKENSSKVLAIVETPTERLKISWNLLAQRVSSSLANDGESSEPLAYDVRTRMLLRMLSPTDHIYATMAIAHMCQARHGDFNGSFSGARPNFREDKGVYDKDYDPELVSAGVRVENKSKWLTANWGSGWSVPRLYDKMQHVLDGGERGIAILWDKRTHSKLRTLQKLTPDVYAALEEVAERHTAPGVGTLEWEQREADFRAALQRHGVNHEELGRELQRDLLAAATAGAFLEDVGSTRTSKAASPKHPYGHQDVVAPGRVIEIDGTPINAFCRDEAGEPIDGEVLVAIDASTRMIVGLRVVAKGMASRDVRLLFFDVLSGRFRREWKIKSDLLWMGVPDTMCIPEGMRPVIKGFKMDRGPQMESYVTMETLQQQGADLNMTPTRSGTAKGIVESFLKHFAKIMQGMPGDKGSSPHHKGDQTGAAPGPTLAQVEYFLREYVLRVYHLKKHENLRDPIDPRRRICPIDCFMNHVSAFREVAVPMDEDFVVQFLFPVPVRASYAGIECDGAFYQSDELDGVRDEDKGRGTRSPDLEARVDPYNPRWILVYHTVRNEWISVPRDKRYNDIQTPGRYDVAHALADRRAAGERTDFAMSRNESSLELGILRNDYTAMLAQAAEEMAAADGATKQQRARDARIADARERAANADPALAGYLHSVPDSDNVVSIDEARLRKEGALVAVGASAADDFDEEYRPQDIPWR